MSERPAREVAAAELHTIDCGAALVRGGDREIELHRDGRMVELLDSSTTSLPLIRG